MSINLNPLAIVLISRAKDAHQFQVFAAPAMDNLRFYRNQTIHESLPISIDQLSPKFLKPVEIIIMLGTGNFLTTILFGPLSY